MQIGMTLFITGAAFMFFAPIIGIVRIDKTKFPFCLFNDIYDILYVIYHIYISF